MTELTIFAGICGFTIRVSGKLSLNIFLLEKIDTQSHALTELNIKIDFGELAKKIQTAQKREDILITAEKTLLRINNIRNPAIVYRWLPIEQSETQHGKSVIRSDNRPIVLNLGHSSIFIKDSSYVLVAAYSAGSDIEKEIQKSSKKEELLGHLVHLSRKKI